MNHQPYETWILDIPPVTKEEKQELASHIKDCPECSRLLEGWKTVEHTINICPTQPAPNDFTRKWSANLARRKRDQEKKQARNLLISFAIGAASIMIAVAIIFLPDLSLISLVAGLISTISVVLSGIGNFWSFMYQLARTVPPSTLIITIAIVSGWVLLACLTLGLSIWKLAFKRGVNK